MPVLLVSTGNFTGSMLRNLLTSDISKEKGKFV